MHADLFDHRLGQAKLAGLPEHPTHATAPLFDEAQLTKYPGNDAIAQVGNPLAHFLDGHTRHQDARTLNFDPIIEEGHPYRCTRVRIIGMNQGVGDGFTQYQQRDAPDILTPDVREIRTAYGMLFQKQHDLLDTIRQACMDLGMIEYMRLVDTDEPATLHPGIWEIGASILPEQQHAALAGYQPALVTHQDTQAQQRLLIQLSPITEQTLCCLDVQIIRPQVRHRHFVEHDAFGGTPQLGCQR